MLTITDDDIRAIVTANAFAAACRYLAQGRVLAVTVAPDHGTITAIVQGSEPRPYRQSIGLHPTRHRFSGTCTCPVGVDCKHVAAALLAAKAGLDDRPHARIPTLPTRHSAPDRTARPAILPTIPAAPSLPPDLAAWLDSLERARDTGDEGYPPLVRQRLLYLVHLAPTARGGLAEVLVEPLKAHLRKDDSLSDRITRYDPTLAFGPQPARFLRPSDHAILHRLYGGRHDGRHPLSGAEAIDTLRRLIATGRARLGALDGPVLVEGEPRPGRLAWHLLADGRQHAAIAVDGPLRALATDPPWYADPGTGVCGPLALEVPPRLAAALVAGPAVPPHSADRVRAELARRLPGLSLSAPAGFGAPERVAGPPAPHLRLIAATLPVAEPWGRGRTRWPPASSAGTERVSMARLSFRYGPALVPLSEREVALDVAREGRLYRIERHRAAESRAVRRLKSLGLVKAGDGRAVAPMAWSPHRDDFRLPDADDDPLAWLDFLYTDRPALEREGWTVEVADDFPLRLARPEGGITAELEQGGGRGAGTDWFELHLGVLVDGERIDLAPLLAELLTSPDGEMALLNALDGQDDPDAPYPVPLPDGRLLALPLAQVRPILAALHEALAGPESDGARRIGFARPAAAELARFERATVDAGVAWRGGEALRRLGARLGESLDAVPVATLPAGLRDVLRPYQARGVDWFQHLGRLGFGGLLADDMGLGKTLQALAHLGLEKAHGRLDRPALVVCPTSLVPAWGREADRFAPELKRLTLHGPGRKARFEAIAQHDLVVTTYPLLARDEEVLTAQPWHVVVLDEAQTIKNPDAVTTRLARRLDARQRLALTGTPVENNLGELWSLLAFAVPGLLGDRQGFARRFRTPIERHRDRERRALLARRVRPFLLRRTKAAVAAELPDKVEIPEPVAMGAAQRAVYEGIRLTQHERVREAIAGQGLARSGLVVLEALLRLRQACCDPRLLKAAPAPARTVKAAGSAKLERLMELLPTLIAEGRRVLLFSQFTGMLALIEAELKRAGLPHLVLTGDTGDRDTPVRRFQAGEVPLFLISLKAGGTGLTLTAADTVIHYDSWWNPAVEDQATDRAHRIGQDKRVFVHKLVTLGTVEEKIEALKAAKRTLAAGILDGSAPDEGFGGLTQAEVEALFAPGNG